MRISCVVGDTAGMKQYSGDLRERALRQVDAGRPVPLDVLIGRHGSLTADEMLVPLLAARA